MRGSETVSSVARCRNSDVTKWHTSGVQKAWQLQRPVYDAKAIWIQKQAQLRWSCQNWWCRTLDSTAPLVDDHGWTLRLGGWAAHEMAMYWFDLVKGKVSQPKWHLRTLVGCCNNQTRPPAARCLLVSTKIQFKGKAPQELTTVVLHLD